MNHVSRDCPAFKWDCHDDPYNTPTAPRPDCTCSHTAAELKPGESLALTVALAQVQRGDEPTPNIATVCVLALARLDGRVDADYQTREIPA